jgi:transcriptional regulator with XRE-family HTH domain
VDAGGAVQFGSLLRQARKQRGMSQAELGGERYTGSYISHLESGRRAASPEVIDFLSRRLGVSPLEWGTSPAGDARSALLHDGAIEDLLVAERAWSERDWGAAITHSKQAAESAAASGDSTRHWEALYVMAQARFSGGEYAAAGELAEQLAEHQTARRFAVARAQALSLASTASRAADRLGWSIAFGARAVEAASAAPPIILTEALMSLVSALGEAGHDLAETRPLLDRLEQLAPRLGSPHSRGTVAWTIGSALCMGGLAQPGLAHHDTARELLDPKRDLRLWLRFHSVAARWRLNADVVDGVPELLRAASFGLDIVGNAHDRAELRQVEAMFALRRHEPEEALVIMQGVLADPETGAPEVSHSGSLLILAHALRALGREDEARAEYARAANAYEIEGRLRAAVDAWRRSVGQPALTQFLTMT